MTSATRTSHKQAQGRCRLAGWTLALLCALVFQNAAIAQDYPFLCKQAGGPNGTKTCTPMKKKGPWNYGFNITSGTVCTSPGLSFSGSNDSLATAAAQFAEDYTYAQSACTEGGGSTVYTIPSCVSSPRRLEVSGPVPGNHLIVIPCASCYLFINGNATGLDMNRWFHIAPPFCGPNATMVATDRPLSCSDEPLMCVQKSEPKDLGEPFCGVGAGNPINIATGNKFQLEQDYVGAGEFPLRLRRYYNSFDVGDDGPIGLYWRTEYQRSIEYFGDGGKPLALARRADGKVLTFTKTGATFTADADIPDRLIQEAPGWRYIDSNDTVELYDTSGRLLSIAARSGLTLTIARDATNRISSVSDSFGRQLTFSYDAIDRIVSATDPAGQTYLYEYDDSNRLAGVGYPDGTSRQYLYNEPAHTTFADLPNALTGVVDENGWRYAVFRYSSNGKAIATSHISTGGALVNTYQVSSGQTSAVITDPLGTSRTNTFQIVADSAKSTGVSQPCDQCGQAASNVSLDPVSGWPTSRLDFRGTVTTYQRTDPNRPDLETRRTEAPYTAQARVIDTTWHPSYRLPATIVEPAPGGSRTTTFSYDTFGNLTQRSVVAPKNNGTAATVTRVWSWTYGTFGRVVTATDPNGNVTTYTYHADNDPIVGKRGKLASITNSLGHATQITAYDAHGRALTTVDPNGLVTALTYDLRGRLTDRNVGGEVTTYTYDGVGQLTGVVMPDSSTLVYTYDAAHRLTKIQDGLGNKIVYTLDNAGNRIQERVYDLGGGLARTRSRIFDALNRLAQELGAQAQTTSYAYDGNGNLLTTTDPLNHATANSYDALNRLVQVLNPGNATTQYSYDADANLAQVTDARGLSTVYTYDGLGNRTKVVSPDTGTATATYDAAGNVLVKTDAVGVTATYTVDALNRTTAVAFSKASTTTETHSFTYDVGANAKGRLTSLVDAAGTTTWTYNAKGRVASKTQTVGGVARTVSYGYNAAGQLNLLITPSGQQIGYSYLNNRIVGVTVNGAPLVTGVVTKAFGPVGAWQWSNGHFTFHDYDDDGRLARWTYRNGADVLRNDITYDSASRVIGIADPLSPGKSGTYQYDAVDRITLAQLGSPVTQTRQYGYDTLGNRTVSSVGAAVATLTYSTVSNQLQAMGGAVDIGYVNGLTSVDFTYSNAGRLATVKSGSTTLATYGVSGLGQRVRKIAGSTTTHFVYGEKGQLLGEYDGAGQLVQETIWLEDIPIATMRPTGTGVPVPIAVYYVHTDHLGTPRAISRPDNDAIVWRWDHTEPFGNSLANENPTGLGIFKYGLRFPGQYFDSEIGTHYNYFRDYDPAIGRYAQSDPIGLDGGINTYLYANADPLSTIDPTGENPAAGIGTIVGAAAIRICMKIPACRAKFAEYAAKAAELCKSVECEVRFDRKGHPFPAAGGGFELCMHWQIDCHIKGVRGAGFSIHSKLPICWKPGTPFPPERPPPTVP